MEGIPMLTTFSMSVTFLKTVFLHFVSKFAMTTFDALCYCGRQEEPAILISRLLLRMRHMYVASIRLDFH